MLKRSLFPHCEKNWLFSQKFLIPHPFDESLLLCSLSTFPGMSSRWDETSLHFTWLDFHFCTKIPLDNITYYIILYNIMGESRKWEFSSSSIFSLVRLLPPVNFWPKTALSPVIPVFPQRVHVHSPYLSQEQAPFQKSLFYFRNYIIFSATNYIYNWWNNHKR